MFFKNKILKILESYLNDPAFHENPIRVRRLSGGPFIRFHTRDTKAIQELYDSFLNDLGHLFELAEAIDDLNAMLSSIEKGSPLEPLYEHLPSAIKGLVELVYDLNNQPNFRFFEGVVYRSRYKLDNYQSVALSLTNSDEREFVLNTPRVQNSDKWKIKRAFSDNLYDVLFKSKYVPISRHEISTIFHKQESDPSLQEIIDLFFTSQASTSHYSSQKPTHGLRVRYFGHACILLESAEISILVDPLISYSYPAEIERFTYFDLPEKIDYLLITHAHQDHVLIEHLLQIRHKVNAVVVPASNGGFLQDPSLKEFFKHLGFKNIIAVSDLDDVVFPGGSITAIPFMGEHGDLDIQSKTGYYINIANKKILLMVDANNLSPDLYAIVKGVIGENIDLLFKSIETDSPPISWVYGAMYSNKLEKQYDHSRRLCGSNFEKARELIDLFNYSQLLLYALAQEPLVCFMMPLDKKEQALREGDCEKMIAHSRSQGKIAERCYGKHEIILS